MSDVLNEMVERGMRTQAEQVTVVSVDIATVRRGARRARGRDALVASAGLLLAGGAAAGIMALPGAEGGRRPATVDRSSPEEHSLPALLRLPVPGGPTLELAMQPAVERGGLRHVVVCLGAGNRWCPSAPLGPDMPVVPERVAQVTDVGQGTNLIAGWLHTDVAAVQVTVGARTADALVASSSAERVSMFAVPYAALGVTQETALAQAWSVRALDASGRTVAQLDRPTPAVLARRHRPAAPPVVLGAGDEVLAAWVDASGTACTAWHTTWYSASLRDSIDGAADWCGEVDPEDVSILADVGFDAASGSLLLRMPPGTRSVTVGGAIAELSQGWGLLRGETPIEPHAAVLVVDHAGRERLAGSVAGLTVNGVHAGDARVVTWAPTR